MDTSNGASARQRFLLYLYSMPNIVGSLLGLLGLLLFFVGVIGPFWYLIVPGLYAIGVLAMPKGRPYDLTLQNQLTADDIRAELDELVRKIEGKVPAEILEAVKSIKGSILQVLPQIIDLGSGDYNIYNIRQTALEYLPRSLQNYLNLPGPYATFVVVKDGKTAKQLLLEQLTLLDTEMKEVVKSVYANDIQQLVVQGRFLKEKFEKPISLL